LRSLAVVPARRFSMPLLQLPRRAAVATRSGEKKSCSPQRTLVSRRPSGLDFFAFFFGVRTRNGT